MFSSSLVTGDTFAWAHHVVVFVAANSIILTPTSCSQPQSKCSIKPVFDSTLNSAPIHLRYNSVSRPYGR